MQTRPPRDASPQPQVFNHSLDWRFLLPLADLRNILVAFERDDDFSQTLEYVGIPVSNQLSFSDILKRETANAPAFALPFGLPVGWVGPEVEAQTEFYRSVRFLLGACGHLLVGFNNSWYAHSRTPSEYYSSTPRRVLDQLQGAGFKSVQLFGALPDLRIPEYTFDLGSRAMLFALHHRFKRKPRMLALLQGLVRTIGPAQISKFMPCYFAVATI